MECNLKKVELLDEDKKWLQFKSTCGCYNHCLNVLMEVDEEIPNTPMLWLHFKVENTVPYYDYPKTRLRIFKNVWYKIKACFKIIFHQRIRFEESFLFQDTQHIQDFIDALNYGLEKLKITK